MELSKESAYRIDLAAEILLLARNAQEEIPKDEFNSGRQMAFYEVLDLMKQQAKVFEMTESEIGLEGVNIENLLF